MSNTWTWAFAVESFARYLEAERGHAPRTVEAYLRDVEEFRRVFAERRGQDPVPARVDITQVRAYLAALFGRNDASSTSRKLSSLRAFFRFLVRRGQVTENPAALVRSPRRRRLRSRGPARRAHTAGCTGDAPSMPDRQTGSLP